MSCIRKPFFYFLLFLSVFACNNENKNSRSLTDKDHLPTEVLEGKNLFEASCVRCHDMDATGLTGPLEQVSLETGYFADEDCSQLNVCINYPKDRDQPAIV